MNQVVSPDSLHACCVHCSIAWVSADPAAQQCWESAWRAACRPCSARLQILQRINDEIEARRQAGDDLPPPPKTALAGPEYFGLNQVEVTILEAYRPALQISIAAALSLQGLVLLLPGGHSHLWHSDPTRGLACACLHRAMPLRPHNSLACACLHKAMRMLHRMSAQATMPPPPS